MYLWTIASIWRENMFIFLPQIVQKYNFPDDRGRQSAFYNMFELLEYHRRILSKITWNNTNVELLRFITLLHVFVSTLSTCSDT